MFKYWIKNRIFLLDILISIILVLFTAFTISKMFSNIGETRLLVSLYESDKLDFDVPSPSYEQITQLESESFIKSVFPYYYTETNLSIGGKNRATKLFFSDAFNKLDQTMYCQSRLIKKSSENYDNPILVDYQFVKDTGATLGSTVSATFGVTIVNFQVFAIYETNTYYDGGAVMAKWGGLQKDTIMSISPKLMYSGAYIQSADYLECKNYLETQYKPYGKLKDLSEFSTPEAYNVHYNAFMSANYANEITNFTLKGQEIVSKVEEKKSCSNLYALISCIIITIVVIVYNIVIWLKLEKNYFAKIKVSGGGNTFAYYLISRLFQAIILIMGNVVSIFVISFISVLYIPCDVVMCKSIMFITVMACVSVIMGVILAQNTKK